MRRLTIFLVTLFSFSDVFRYGTVSAATSALALPSVENKIKIDLIDVKCDKDKNGMHITINFNQEFGGVIYSQGHFNNPKCRYVSVGENSKSYSFIVPYNGCGSKPSCAICDSIDNILIIQQDEEVQGEFDTARKVSCSHTGIDQEKKVFFKPFIVDMLDVITVPTSSGGVDCWMDIQRGIYPQLTAIGKAIKIGEELSVLIYLRDEKHEFDLTARNCWAYDNESFDDKTTGKIQLSDASGCSMKRKLFGVWQKTQETGSSGATLLLHNTLRAFKFPDESQVYLKCDIEICRGTCAEAICDDDFNEINTLEKFTTPFSYSQDKFTTTNEPYTEITTRRIGTRFPLEETTQKVNFDIDVRGENLINNNIDDDQSTTKRPSFRCYPGSKDARCVQQKYFETPTTFAPRDFTYPNAFKTSSTTTTTPTPTTKKPTFCGLYPNSQRCLTKTPPKPEFPTEKIPAVEIFTLQPPSYQVSSKQSGFDCSRQPNDVRCRQLVIPLQCGPGSLYDVRCPNPTPTATPPTYLPPSTTLPSRPTEKFIICVGDDCDVKTGETTTEVDLTTLKNTTPSEFATQRTTKKTVCLFGSRDPECRKAASTTLFFKPQTSTVATPLDSKSTAIPAKPFFTTRASNCYPGSLDSRCQASTTVKTVSSLNPSSAVPFVTEYSTAKPFRPEPTVRTFENPICGFGSRGIECQKVSTNDLTLKPQPSTTVIPSSEKPFLFSTTVRPISTTKVPICYPGSLDVRCKIVTSERFVPSISSSTKIPLTTTFTPDTSTTAAFKCFPGSSDSRCAVTNQFDCTKNPNDLRCSRLVVPLRCGPSFPYDVRCPNPTPTATAPTYLPPVTTSKPTTRIPFIQSTTRKPLCSFGSTDPECLRASTLRPQPSSSFIPSSIQPTSTTARTFPTFSTFSTTRAPLCYPGSLDPRCKVATTQKVFQSSSEIPVTTTFIPNFSYPSKETKKPICYFGSKDPECVKVTTNVFTFKPQTSTVASPSSTQFTTPKIPTFSTTRAPLCYPGSLDPRCKVATTQKVFQSSSEIPVTTTFTPNFSYPTKETKKSICYFGSKDPECLKVTTKVFTLEPQTSTVAFPSSTQFKTPKIPTFSTTSAPLCYSGSLDPRCKLAITQKVFQSSSEIPFTTTFKPEFSNPTKETKKPNCYFGSKDPECLKVTSNVFTFKPQTSTIASPSSTQFTTPKITTTSRTFSTREPFCYPGALDPRCKSSTITTPKAIPSFGSSSDVPVTSTFKPFISTSTGSVTTAAAQFECYPGSFDPRCATNQLNCDTNPKDVRCNQVFESLRCGPGFPYDPRCPNPTPTATAPTYLPPVTTKFTTPQPTQKPSSTIATTKFTSRPETSSEKIIPTTPRYSTPGPFTARPTLSSTTENILCYPGSTIPGCKSSFTTPTFCYPGSKDKRCPQLPDTFSTRQPSTYLPPFLDSKPNRVKRNTLIESPNEEIIEFSISMKSFSVSA